MFINNHKLTNILEKAELNQKVFRSIDKAQVV
jgi:hypothetical protein